MMPMIPLAQRVTWLAGVPAFAMLPSQVLEELAVILHEEHHPAGSTVMTEGEVGDQLYLIVEGHAEVSTTGPAGPVILATLEPGELFGEIALLSPSHQRQATVTALTPLLTLTLTEPVFQNLLCRYSAAEQAFASAAELLATVKFLKQASPFTKAEAAVLRHLAERLEGLSVPAGSVIMQQGEQGESCYLLRTGQVEVLVQEDGGGERRLAILGPGALFGEAALLMEAPRNATVRALEPCELLALHRCDLLEAMGATPRVAALVHLSRGQRVLLLARQLLEWRVALQHVDAPITRLYRSGVHRLYTRWGQLAIGLLSLAGLIAFVVGSARAGASLLHTDGGPTLFFFLVPAYVLSIVIHEAGHAFTTKAFGREVPRVGVGWYWFTPVAFVDTSDIWLAERWPRIAVSLAGPYANLVLAAIAALAAWCTSNPVVTGMLGQFAFVSYVIVLLNLNPLLEYNGYYVLMDLLERPNLRRHALAWLGQEFPRALRTPGGLQGHGMELVLGLGSLLYVALMSALAVVFYRLLMQDWMTHLLPGTVAASLAWVIAVGAAVLSSTAVAGELRGAR